MNKLPLVLLTGLLSNEKVFSYQATKLRDISDILIINLLDVNSPLAMTEKILSLTPKYFNLVGHSLGGWAAMQIMKIAPEKINKLCLLNTSARGIDAKETHARWLTLTRIKQGQFAKIADEIATQFTFNQNVKKDITTMFLQAGKEALVNQTQVMLLREDLRPVLPTINCPTLVIHAAQDKRFSLAHLKEIANNIPNSRLAIIDYCGHMAPMENPYVVANLIRQWLL